MRELEVMAQKALEAAGVTPGLDRDGAFATVWYEARGLGGVEMLIRDFNALCGVPTRIGDRMDAGGMSALVAAPMAIDLAMVMDLELTVQNIRSPLAAVAYAVRRSGNGRWFRLSWGDNEALAVDGTAAIALTGPDAATVLTIVSDNGSPPAIFAPVVSAGELEQRRVHALKEGVFITRQARKTLLAAANGVLVPASESSRSGAGAEVDDSE